MKSWFITGVSRGLGLALAEAALARGDTVVGTIRGEVPRLARGSGTLHLLPLEVTDPSVVEAVVEQAWNLAGGIDILVNNAGYGLLGPIEQASDKEVEQLFAVNLFGPLRLIRAFLPRFRGQGSGHVINITSIAGRDPMPASGLYAAAKAAMEGLSQALAREVEPLGLRVTAVAPGGFRTGFLSEHSIRRSGGAVPDGYSETVGQALAQLGAMAGTQIGDPARGAAAIIAAADAVDPPRHLLLGSDALRRARDNLDAVIDEIDAWEELTRATDFPKEDTMKSQATIGLIAALSTSASMAACAQANDTSSPSQQQEASRKEPAVQHPYVGMWITDDGRVRHQLLPNGRYDEARGRRESAYRGRYNVSGSHIEYWDDTSFTADGDFVDANTLHHGGMILRRR